MCPRRCHSCGNTTHCFPSFFFQHRTVSSHDTDINSAGEEEAPCTNASHACTGSLLKRALNNLKKSRTWHTSSAGGSPWALVPPNESSGLLDRASKMTACSLLSHKRSSAKRHGRATLLFSEEVFHAVADLMMAAKPKGSRRCGLPHRCPKATTSQWRKTWRP